jgi:DUF4097 and DUF4098 domain-containing protein YvlB
VHGSITVIGAAIQDVVFETAGREFRRPDRETGMRRIGGGGELTITEANNEIRIHSVSGNSHNLTLQVPSKTSLALKSINNSGIRVDNIEGEVEVSNTNGCIRLNGISGSVVANTLNGRIELSLDKAAPDKPMSLTTLNGNIDVVFPADLKATLRMRADNGDIYSDMELSVRSERTQTETSKGRVRFENVTIGVLNGGGPEIRLQTRNGKITVRKKP